MRSSLVQTILITLDGDEVRKELGRLLATKGSFNYRKVYPTGTCRYVVEGLPGCLIGQVVYNLTGSLVPNECERSGVLALTDAGKLKFSDSHAEMLCAKAQGYQDDGTDWGDAITRAWQETGYDIENPQP